MMTVFPFPRTAFTLATDRPFQAVVDAVEAIKNRLLKAEADDVTRQRVEGKLGADQVVLGLVVRATGRASRACRMRCADSLGI